jgi:hypothetical protein
MADQSTALKNANDMLKDVIKAMDKNGDQVISYEGTSYTIGASILDIPPSVCCAILT